MQDKYTGDIGDFGKFHLLQCVEKTKLKLGINWYYTKPYNYKEMNNGDGSIKTKDIAMLDIDLSNKINKIFEKGSKRSIKDLENSKLLKTKKFYSAEVPQNSEKRMEWHSKAIRFFSDSDIIFLDPDNGLLSKQKTHKTKYVTKDEINDYIKMKKTIILYSSRGRRKACEYFNRFKNEFGAQIIALSFHKGSLRDYIFITKNKHHIKKLKIMFAKILESNWNGIFRDDMKTYFAKNNK